MSRASLDARSGGPQLPSLKRGRRVEGLFLVASSRPSRAIVHLSSFLWLVDFRESMIT